MKICAQCHGNGVLSGNMRICPRCLGCGEEPDAVDRIQRGLVPPDEMPRPKQKRKRALAGEQAKAERPGPPYDAAYEQNKRRR